MIFKGANADSGFPIRLQIAQKASLNAWDDFYPAEIDEYEEVRPYLVKAIQISRKVDEYRLRMQQNLNEVDKIIQKPQARYRLALAVRYLNHGEYQVQEKESEVSFFSINFELISNKPFNYLHQNELDENKWISTEDCVDGFYLKSEKAFTVVGLVLEVNFCSKFVTFNLRLGGSQCEKNKLTNRAATFDELQYIQLPLIDWKYTCDRQV